MSASDAVDKKKMPCWTALEHGGNCSKQQNHKCPYGHAHMISDIPEWLEENKEVKETEEYKAWLKLGADVQYTKVENSE